MSAEVVKLAKPSESAELAEFLRQMADRAESGEFDTIYAVFRQPSGEYLTIERGKGFNSLEIVGLLETMKFDKIKAGVADE